MSLSFTDAAMTYLGQQIGANNKVPAGQSFLIAIAIMEAEGDDALFLIKGTYSNGAVSNLDKTFAQITAASSNDKVIVMKLTEGSSYYYLPCAKLDSSSVVFADDIESGLKVTISSADAVTVGTATAAVSWNDITDRPFYETVTAAGYNFEIDLDDPNYVSGYFNIDEEIPCRFYRVGDPLTAAQLEGAMGTFNYLGENGSHVIKSNYIDEIEDNGNTVGLFVADDIPYALVINNANTTIDYTGAVFGCSGTFAAAGTYLFWLDLSSAFGDGAAAYNPSLVKADETVITQLPDKYYKTPLYATADLDLTNLSVSNVSNSFAEILAAMQGGRTTTLLLQFTNQGVDFTIPLYTSLVSELQIHFSVTAPYTLTGNTNIYTIDVYINSNDSVHGNFYLHDATAQ